MIVLKDDLLVDVVRLADQVEHVALGAAAKANLENAIGKLSEQAGELRRALSQTIVRVHDGHVWLDLSGDEKSAAAVVAHLLKVQVDSAVPTSEQLLVADILDELTRARTKFTGKNVTFAALVEEVGELATATFDQSRDHVRKEAVQVAVMAMRMVLEGDHTFDEWRQSKGLDALVPSPCGQWRKIDEILRHPPHHLSAPVRRR